MEFCLDCSKKMVDKRRTRCRNCYRSNIKKVRHLKYNKFNYICPKRGNKKSFHAKRCKECYKIDWIKNIKRVAKGKPKCIDCGKTLSSYSKKVKRCLNCIHKFQKGINNPNWKGGKSFEPYPLGWTKIYKEQIRYRDNYKCQICGIPEIECIKKLCIHHIDYNKKNIKENNLISLCKKCHSKTNGNRNYWKKNLKVRRNTNEYNTYSCN